MAEPGGVSADVDHPLADRWRFVQGSSVYTVSRLPGLPPALADVLARVRIYEVINYITMILFISTSSRANLSVRRRAGRSETGDEMFANKTRVLLIVSQPILDRSVVAEGIHGSVSPCSLSSSAEGHGEGD
jgi:hypothetical protein